MKLTYIEWDDCHAPPDGPWVSTSSDTLDITDPLVIVTVGFVVKENEHYVQIAASCDYANASSGDFEGTDVAGVMSIPKRQISKRVEFEIGRRVDRAPRIEYVQVKGEARKRKRRAG